MTSTLSPTSATADRTLQNLPPPAPSPAPSTPGTPMSGISTVAIKDGHEGHAPSRNFDGTAERLSRLASTDYFGGSDSPRRPAPLSSNPSETDTPAAVDEVRRRIVRHAIGAGTPGAAALSNASTPGGYFGIKGGGGSADETPASETNTPAEIDEVRRRVVRHAIGAPTPGGLTGEVEREVEAWRNGMDTPESGSTSASGKKGREEARMLGGMTYDEGVVDTTDRKREEMDEA